MEQTVDDAWQIIDAGDRELQTEVSEISWSPEQNTAMDRHSELVLQPLRNSQLVQVIMHQP